MTSKSHTLAALQRAQSLKELAPVLGFAPRAISHLLYVLPEDKKYKHTFIPKRDGQQRKISSPEPRLKALQSLLASLLYNCEAELLPLRPRTPLSHAFREGRSIITNASQHKGRRYVLNCDIADFFGAINFGRVRGFFINDKHYRLHPKVATVLAQIACHQNALPQGSPCSPIISDLIGSILDRRLVHLAKRNFLTYSRYADDLTFSTNAKAFPKHIATLQSDGTCELGPALYKEIERSGFLPNERKTRLQHKASRQDVTGLTVNRKVNVQAARYRRLRAQCNKLFQESCYILDPTIDSTPTEKLDPIGGLFSHVANVKEFSQGAHTSTSGHAAGFKKLYAKFLSYKLFFRSNKPVIVCEGKTDNIYLRCAINQLSPEDLISKQPNGKVEYAAQFFKYTRTTARYLKLTGGSNDLLFFFTKGQDSYWKFVQSFKHKGGDQPVIVIVDNDGGAKTILKKASELSGTSISLQSTRSNWGQTTVFHRCRRPRHTPQNRAR